jgi:hypothetical protein
MRKIAGVLVLAVIASMLLWRDTQQEAETCVDVPKITVAAKAAATFGGVVHEYLKKDGYTQEQIKKAWEGGGFVAGMLWSAFYTASQEGKDAGLDVVIGMLPETTDCTPAVDCSQPAQPDTPDPGQPYDPKLASLQGPDLAADALRRAAPRDRKWLAQIPLGVSIAKYESSFNPTASNNVASGHVGLWQISGANAAVLKKGNRTDPYANARYAYAIWKGRGGTWSKDWTVYQTALAEQDEYARYGSAPVLAAAAGVAPADPQPRLREDGETFEPDVADCEPGSGDLGVTVGTWNTAEAIGNSNAEINRYAGFATVVGLQEIRDNDALRVRGYGVTPGNMAVPIIYKRSDVELISWDRERALTGGPTRKWVVWAVFETKDGKRFAVVNTHQLVEGGDGWIQQARVVNDTVDELKADGLVVILVGDMNGSESRVAAAFGAAGTGGRIDRIIPYGAKASKTEQLGKGGSDHYRYRAAFPGSRSAGEPFALSGDLSGRTTMDGKAVSRVVAAQILLAERESGIDFTVMQGGFGGGDVPASGTSHDWPGVVDLSPGTVEAEKALRQAGFASWARNIPGRSYAGSGAHNHAVSLLDPGNKGHGQLAAWERGEDGLRGRKDPAPHYPWYPALRTLRMGGE